MNQNLFAELPLVPELLRAIGEMGFSEPTPIQAQSIPLILEGRDVVGRSQTGTGKTAAFGIPAIQMVDPNLDRRMAQILLLCPTRELAVQACEELKKLAHHTRGVHVCAVYGGAPIERQIVQLKDANIVVGTPGRVMDHLRRRTLKISELRMVILDEADEMLSMGFREDIETILTQAPENRQTILFSATMPKEIMNLIDNYQKDPVLVEINKSQVALNSIEQFYYDIPTGRKNDALGLLLHYYAPSRSMVFCNTKKMVDDLTGWLLDHGFKAEGLHGDMKQSQRTVVMDAFKAGRTSILVATDVAARGIDVDDINCVFNYDIPQNAEYYVHRIGRTGRAGKSGSAYTLCCGRNQLRQMEQILRFAKAQATLAPVPMPDEILQKRREEGAQKLRTFLTGKTDFPYLDMVLSLMHTEDEKVPTFSAEQIAAAALELLYGAQQSDLPDATGLNREKKRRSPKDYVKFIIDAGYNARMVPNFIVGAIAERTGLSGRDIGKSKSLRTTPPSRFHRNRPKRFCPPCRTAASTAKRFESRFSRLKNAAKVQTKRRNSKRMAKKPPLRNPAFKIHCKRGFSRKTKTTPSVKKLPTPNALLPTPKALRKAFPKTKNSAAKSIIKPAGNSIPNTNRPM